MGRQAMKLHGPVLVLAARGITQESLELALVPLEPGAGACFWIA